uniref:Uncharacterized protein n=1 Tax=virus sp. ctx9V1 TaxID=2828001 RepID=A0A8S5RDT5_9VIRU|nr:MAG TPA: hypothetical protein [virus sp. ctx9V1]
MYCSVFSCSLFCIISKVFIYSLLFSYSIWRQAVTMRISRYRVILSFRIIYRSRTHLLVVFSSILLYSSTIIKCVHLIKVFVIFWLLPSSWSILPFFLVYTTTCLFINKLSSIFILLIAILFHQALLFFTTVLFILSLIVLGSKITCSLTIFIKFHQNHLWISWNKFTHSFPSITSERIYLVTNIVYEYLSIIIYIVNLIVQYSKYRRTRSSIHSCPHLKPVDISIHSLPEKPVLCNNLSVFYITKTHVVVYVLIYNIGCKCM